VTDRQRSFLSSHRHVLITVGVALGAAVGAGYKAISDARAEQRPQAVVEVPAPDVSGLRQDIGYLREDIREERHERYELTKQMGEFNGRLQSLEGAAHGKKK
jgi:hypothetical protein